MTLLVATQDDVLIVDADRGATTRPRRPPADRPTCLAADPLVPGRAWYGTRRAGVFRTEDGGVTWEAVGLEGRLIMSIAASPAREGLVWAGTEPSAVWRSEDGGGEWEPARALDGLPSSSEWSFPPKPETHHVRWIACHTGEPGRLWVAIEAGALVSTMDGGRTWRDRVPGGPWDTHELAVHPAAPDTLRVSAGDGYFESRDAGATWSSPEEGLEVGYLRSVAIDPAAPDVVVVSAASGPRTAYVAGLSDGRLYRREGTGAWRRVRAGWPDPPATIAPLLSAGVETGVDTVGLWAADERGVHRSEDGGHSWRAVAGYPSVPNHLRGLAPVRPPS